jgi:hypothetical protein
MPVKHFQHSQAFVDEVVAIEIGLEQAPFVFFNFFSAFEHVKSLLIMGPNNTKNSSVKCDFHVINYE